VAAAFAGFIASRDVAEVSRKVLGMPPPDCRCLQRESRGELQTAMSGAARNGAGRCAGRNQLPSGVYLKRLRRRNENEKGRM